MCDRCRPSFCTFDSRCEDCTSWSSDQFNIFVKFRLKRERDRNYKDNIRKSRKEQSGSSHDLSPSPSVSSGSAHSLSEIPRPLSVPQVGELLDAPSEPVVPLEPVIEVVSFEGKKDKGGKLLLMSRPK